MQGCKHNPIYSIQAGEMSVLIAVIFLKNIFSPKFLQAYVQCVYIVYLSKVSDCFIKSCSIIDTLCIENYEGK